MKNNDRFRNCLPDSGLVPVPDIVSAMANGGRPLTDQMCDRIIEWGGSNIVSQLIELLLDESLADVDARGKGYVPINAVRVLRRLRPVEAVEPMLKVMRRCDFCDVLKNEIIFALKEFGEVALEPALKAYIEEQDNDESEYIAEILSGLNVRDERIYQVLLHELENDVILGAGNLGEYGDDRAVPVLSALLERGDLDNWEEVESLVLTIEELGGELTAQQRLALKTALKPKKAKPIAMYALPRPGVGIRF